MSQLPHNASPLFYMAFGKLGLPSIVSLPLLMYLFYVCVVFFGEMWVSSIKAWHAVSFVFFSDHVLPGALLSSTYVLLGHTDHCKHWSQYYHPYLGHRSPFRFVREMLSARTLPRLRCGVTIVLCWGAQVSYLHLKSSGNSFLRSTAGARGQRASGVPLWLLASGLLKQSVAVIAAQWESSPCHLPGCWPQPPARQPQNTLINLCGTTGTAGVPLIHLPLFLWFICVYIERWWYLLAESPGEPWGRHSISVISETQRVTFLKDLAKGSHLAFFKMCSSSEPIHLLWAYSFPVREVVRFYYIYLCFPFYAVHPLFSYHITNTPLSSGLLLPLCHPPQDSLCNTWYIVTRWSRITSSSCCLLTHLLFISTAKLLVFFKNFTVRLNRLPS